MNRARKLGLLSALYLVQGLPYGFQVTALPVYLRERGLSLGDIGLVGALAAPWALKALWAPLVDRYWWPRLGRRRSWLLPLQLLLVLTCMLTALVHADLRALLACVFVLNLLAATQDIAVDGLAVDLLREEDLGLGNAAQVCGYKVGMIAGGGTLVALSRAAGWSWGAVFLGMGLLTLLVFGLVLVWTEPQPARAAAAPPTTLLDVLRALRRAVATRAGLWLIAFLLTYRLGESMVDVMMKPFLVDAGFKAEQITRWMSEYGIAAGLLGSLLGGVVAMRFDPWRVLLWAALLRCLPLAAEVDLASTYWTSLFDGAGGLPALEARAVILVTCAEHFTSGVLTTALFAFMMSRVDPSIGASHYTLLASVEVLGKFSGTLSGFVAERLGYAGLFAAGTLASLVLLLPLLPLRPARAAGAPA